MVTVDTPWRRNFHRDEVRRISHYPRRDGKLPEGARYVGRPSRWGNPYKVADMPAAEAVRLYRLYAAEQLANDPGWLDPLKAASALACACALDEPCHAQVLVELLADPGGTYRRRQI